MAGKSPLAIPCAVGTAEPYSLMSYFKDLSDYCYTKDSRSAVTRIGWLGLSGARELAPPRVKNVGWLAHDHEYPKQIPSEEILDLLWEYCAISVNQMRGIHPCPFCPQIEKIAPPFLYEERNGQRKMLRSAEIRVFSQSGDVYAAPTLVFHSVSRHHYDPPTEFLDAMRTGPKPPSPDYFRKLEQLGLDWNKAALPKSS